MNAREQKAEAARKQALRDHLRGNGGEPDPASLSRSYALPRPIVEQLIREAAYAR